MKTVQIQFPSFLKFCVRLSTCSNNIHLPRVRRTPLPVFIIYFQTVLLSSAGENYLTKITITKGEQFKAIIKAYVSPRRVNNTLQLCAVAYRGYLPRRRHHIAEFGLVTSPTPKRALARCLNHTRRLVTRDHGLHQQLKVPLRTRREMHGWYHCQIFTHLSYVLGKVNFYLWGKVVSLRFFSITIMYIITAFIV